MNWDKDKQLWQLGPHKDCPGGVLYSMAGLVRCFACGKIYRRETADQELGNEN